MALAKNDEAALELPDQQAGLVPWADNQDTGFEETAPDDYALPMMKMLQAQSPEAMDGAAEYIDGASAGMLIDSVRVSPVKLPCAVVLAHFQSRWVEWIPRDAGGGIVRRYEPGEDPPGGAGQIRVNVGDKIGVDKEGNDLFNQAVLTHYHYLLYQQDEEWHPVVFPMSGTGITISKKWNTSARMTKRRRWESLWTLDKVLRSNDQGNWYVIAPKLHSALSDAVQDDVDLMSLAYDLYTQVRGTDVALSTDAEARASGEGGQKGDIPF